MTKPAPKNLTGTLTWNANSTLGRLAITDQFNSQNTQTCKYGDPSAVPPIAGYDDMTRLVSANCGSVAAQTFSYDPFGNINKQGSPYTFNAFYSSSTNRITYIGGSGQNCTGGVITTYDANGNVTSDSNHSYSWDSDGNSVSVDTVSLTFDALDRMVEQNRSGSYTQILYGPRGGKLALMNGQSLIRAFISLPSHASAVYTTSGLDHYRHSDWLGSARLTSSPSQSYVSSVAYAPFGETYSSLGTTDPSFTGQNPDTVSTNYDFLAREYSNQGRWASPDPAGLNAVNPSNPQSLNRYSYVRNMPVMLTDPLGLLPGGCNTVQNREPNRQQDSDGGGPLASDSSADPAAPQARCGGGPPCDYTLAGCAGMSLDGVDTAGLAPGLLGPGESVVCIANCGGIFGDFGLGGGYNGGPPWFFCDPNLDPSCGPRSWCDPGIDLNCILPISIDLNLARTHNWLGLNTTPPKPTKTDRLISLKGCIDTAASAKNSELWGAAGENFIGGVTILSVVGLAGASLPAFYAGAGEAEGLGDFLWEGYHAVDMTGRFALFTLPGFAVYGKGIFDASNAINDFDLAVAGCQAQTGYPNVP